MYHGDVLEGLANGIAIALSIWVGMHYRAPEWLAIYGAAAAATAALPAHRFVGAIGLAVGLAVAVGGAFLLKGSHVALGEAFSATGGPLAPAREALGVILTALWLVVASAIRLRRA